MGCVQQDKNTAGWEAVWCGQHYGNRSYDAALILCFLSKCALCAPPNPRICNTTIPLAQERTLPRRSGGARRLPNFSRTRWTMMAEPSETCRGFVRRQRRRRACAPGAAGRRLGHRNRQRWGHTVVETSPTKKRRKYLSLSLRVIFCAQIKPFQSFFVHMVHRVQMVHIVRTVHISHMVFILNIFSIFTILSTFCIFACLTCWCVWPEL
jgi:hypothetical protein